VILLDFFCFVTELIIVLSFSSSLLNIPVFFQLDVYLSGSSTSSGTRCLTFTTTWALQRYEISKQ
jgi:hypothetical protein